MLLTKPIHALKRDKVGSFYLYCEIRYTAKTKSVAFVDVSSGTKFLTRSTMRVARQKCCGIDYQVVICDITSDSHPAFTGENDL